MNMEVKIKNSKERVRIILKIKKIIELAGYKATVFASDKDNCDMGLSSEPVDKKTLAKVISQIERKGYTINADGPA